MALTPGTRLGPYEVTFSLDGQWLVYDSTIRRSSDIFRIPLTGGEPAELASDPADEFAADLSPGVHRGQLRLNGRPRKTRGYQTSADRLAAIVASSG